MFLKINGNTVINSDQIISIRRIADSTHIIHKDYGGFLFPKTKKLEKKDPAHFEIIIPGGRCMVTEEDLKNSSVLEDLRYFISHWFDLNGN